jgi:hypothetical protein
MWLEGVEVLEFCLFLVVFPARCISSISPRVYFRKHALCFLPLVTILESPREAFLIESDVDTGAVHTLLEQKLETSGWDVLCIVLEVHISKSHTITFFILCF